MAETKNKGGQPTKYNESRITELEEYTKDCEMNNDLPTLEKFAYLIGVHKDTIQEWSNVHPLFSVSVKKLLSLQAHILQNRGLDKKYNYNVAMAIFLLKNNHGFKDRIDHTTDDKPFPAPIYGVNPNVISGNNSDKED